MKRSRRNQDENRIYFPFANDSVAKLYARFRAQGTLSRWALQHARTVAEFYEFGDLVRLVAVPDECCSLDDLKGDCFDFEASGYTGTRAQLAREEKEFEENVARNGVYGLVGQYRTSEDSEDWIDADSCFGFIGTDNIGCRDSSFGGYEFDLMSETCEALRNALCDNVASL